MASFCGTCGAPLADQATFCGGCGARKTTTGQDAQYQPVQQHVPPQPGATSVPSTAAAPAKSNALLKVGIAAVAVVAVGGVAAVAGVMYVGHKVIEKVHAVTGQASGEKTPADGGLASLLKSGGGSDTDATIKGDPCRFLSTEDVSHAVGITIVWSGIVAFISYKIADLLVGMRVTEEEEREGLDIRSHGETAYN